jgi:hypothetical protein
VKRVIRQLRSARSAIAGVAVAVGLLSPLAAGAPPPLSIAVQPTELVLPGVATGAFTVINPTGRAISLNASLGDYVIKSNGTVVINPTLPPQRSAKRWLTLSSTRLDLGPHGRKQLIARSQPAANADPGDHHALVLFTTATSGSGRVLVRTRIAVAVLVRVKGPIKRRLTIASMTPRPKRHQLRLVIANAGNINERLLRRSVQVTLKRNGRIVQKLVGSPRDVLPHTRTVFTPKYRKRLSGKKLVAVVTIRPATTVYAGAFAPPLRPIKKTFRLKL